VWIALAAWLLTSAGFVVTGWRRLRHGVASNAEAS
jgi:hypothetical protein